MYFASVNLHYHISNALYIFPVILVWDLRAAIASRGELGIRPPPGHARPYKFHKIWTKKKKRKTQRFWSLQLLNASLSHVAKSLPLRRNSVSARGDLSVVSGGWS